MNTDLTVIIPTKNRLWSLPQAIASCRSAELRLQIIVVDDASTDGTTEWLRHQSDVITVTGYGWGKPWAVNHAVGLATGTYLRYLDSDDWLNPGANEEQFKIAERETADVVVSGLDIYFNDTFIESIPWEFTDDFVAQQLGETQRGSHYSSFLFRRRFVETIPHRTLFPGSVFSAQDDRCFILEVALRHPRIAVSPKPALCHRHHDRPRLQGHTGLKAFCADVQGLYILRQILGLLESQGELTLRRKRAAINGLWQMAHNIARVQPEEACSIVRWIHELDPDFRPPEPRLLGFLYRQIGFRGTQRLLRLRRLFLKMSRITGRNPASGCHPEIV